MPGGPPADVNWPLCINPSCFRWGTSLLEFATAARAAGFERIEISIQQALTLAQQVGGLAALAGLFSEMNLRIEQFSGLLPAGPVLPAPLLIETSEWKDAWTTMDDRLAAAAALGCRRAAIVCNPRTDLPLPAARREAVQRLTMLADRADPYGVRLAVEFIGVRSGLDPALDGRHPFISDLTGMLDLLSEVSHPGVGLLLDTCHLYASETTPAEIANSCRGLITFVQVSDLPAAVAPEDARDDLRCPPGQGALDLPAFLGAIAGSGYDGPVSIELFSSEIWNLSPDAAARRLLAAGMQA